MDQDADFTLAATGDVYPCRAVCVDPSGDHLGTQATANARAVGISIDGTKYPPGTTADVGKLAEAGDSIPVYGPGRKCQWLLGGTVTRNDLLVADANGQGVTAASTGTTVQWVLATALESGIAGQQVLVVIMPFAYRPALS